MPPNGNKNGNGKNGNGRKISTTGETMRKIAPFIKPFKWRIFGLIGLTAVLSVIAMLPPLYTRAIINNVIGRKQGNLLFGIAIAMIATPILHAVISYIQVVGIAWIGQTFVLRVRMAVYRHLLGMHIGYFTKTSTGKLTNRIMGDSSVMQNMLNVESVQIISDLVCSFFAITATLYINWRLSIPIVIILILFLTNYSFNIPKIKRAWVRVRDAEDRLASGVQDRLVANMTIKAYGTEEREQAAFNDHSVAVMDRLYTSWSASSDFGINTDLLQSVGRTFVFFIGCAM
ncbi:MAG: ABC transporter ATP-binding protein, partial [Kiritimatiellaeota bacterium]|nr:ABC transporter ATP-binding protein [Kiritimatiellota bacterium]